MSLKWLPNTLTAIRIAAAPVICWLIFAALASNEAPIKEMYASVAFALFTLAAMTDWLDGFLARKLDAASAFGAKLDLWADKILVLAVLLGMLAFFPLIAIIGLLSLSVRDVLIMRLRATRPDVNLKATFLAKSKTAIIMAAMGICLFGYAFTMQGIRNTDEAMVDAMVTIIRIGLSLFMFGCVLSLGTALQYYQAAMKSPEPS